jgi:hypothetical protein
MNSIEAVCNAALDQIGYKRHIGSIYDGTPGARIALDVWGQTRDEVLSAVKPYWARKDAVLTVKRQAPADFYQSVNWSNIYPPFPYLFSYSFPTDCLVPLQVKPRPFIAAAPWRPRYIAFREATDAVDGATVILTNQASAALVYIAQILDPSTWHDEFTALIVQSLAQKFQPLVGAPPREPRNADAA